MRLNVMNSRSYFTISQGLTLNHASFVVSEWGFCHFLPKIEPLMLIFLLLLKLGW